jgi:nitroreductase/dihydropteridine reductase
VELNTVLESVRLSPSGAGLQLYKLIVVEDHDTRVLLGEYSFTNKARVVNASQLLVFAIY